MRLAGRRTGSFDGAINYKTDDLDAKLAKLAPDGIDIYFENTGGPIQRRVPQDECPRPCRGLRHDRRLR